MVTYNTFRQILVLSQNPLGLSTFLILAWIAHADGELDNAERQALQQLAGTDLKPSQLAILFELAQSADLRSLQLSAEIIQKHLSSVDARLFLQFAILMTIADGKLTPSENIILRFLADLLRVSTANLGSAFVEVTSKPFPDPPDLSTADMWLGNGDKKQHRESDEETRASIPKRIHSLAMLGLDESATLNDIKESFRRLAKVHHPDRFTSLGENAVRAATVSFQRIQNAYDYLLTNAGSL